MQILYEFVIKVLFPLIQIVLFQSSPKTCYTKILSLPYFIEFVR